MKRLLGLLVLLGLTAAALYYWKARPAALEITGLAGKRLDPGRLTIGKITIPSGMPAALEKAKDKIADAAVQTSVKTAFALHRGLEPLGLEVEVKDRVVTLRGAAPDAEARASAERIAGMVPEVKEVRNEIRTGAQARGAPSAQGRSLGEKVDDEKLALQVRLALSLNRRLQDLKIDVSAFRGQVRLRGEVTNEEQKALAGAVSGDVPGVSGVTNSLGVRTDTSSKDRAVR